MSRLALLVVFVTASCHEDDLAPLLDAPAVPVDGASPSPPTDASLIDPPVGLVSVVASSILESFDVTTWIVVHDRLGQPWSVTLPRAMWTQIEVPAEASVTVLQRSTGGGALRRTTFVGVEPFDVLQTATTLDQSFRLQPATIRFPRLSSAARYRVEMFGDPACTRELATPAGDPPVLEVALQKTMACILPGPQMLIVSALDAGGALIGSISAYGSLSPTLVDLSAKPWSPPVEARLTVGEGSPYSSREVCLRAWMPETELPLTNILRRAHTAKCTEVPPSVPEVTVRVPQTSPVTWEHVLTTKVWTPRYVEHRHVQLWATLDTTFDDPSWMASPVPTLDIEASGSRPVVRIDGTLEYLGGVTTIYDDHWSTWTIVHPRATSFRVPALPPGFEAYGVTGPRSAEARLYLASQFGTYAQLRTEILPRGSQDPMEQRSVLVRSW